MSRRNNILEVRAVIAQLNQVIPPGHGFDLPPVPPVRQPLPPVPPVPPVQQPGPPPALLVPSRVPPVSAIVAAVADHTVGTDADADDGDRNAEDNANGDSNI